VNPEAGHPAPPPGRPRRGLLFRLIDLIGQATSLLVFALIAILLYGVVMRYVVDRPSVWVSEASGMIYAAYFLIGGAYALIHGDHVNVDILRARFSPRRKAALDLFTWLLFYAMMGTIFWLGLNYGWKSLLRLERSSTVWGPYIWPLKMLVPVSAFLMLVAGAMKTVADIRIVLGRTRGRR
jgi:TRAP-type mannitol/chloroaromatic compound transport system permease small subunit